jgi:integrase
LVELGGNSRKNTPKTLAAATIALLRVQPTQFAPVAVRTALRDWAFNSTRRVDAPRDVVTILRWVKRSTLPVLVWEEAEMVDGVLRAVDTRLDAKQAAAWSSVNGCHQDQQRRGQTVLDECGPGGGTPRLDPSRPRGAMRLHTFFATLYYCGPRPEEAKAMRVKDVTLPGPDAGDQWRELLIHTATPEVGKRGTTPERFTRNAT